MLSSGYDPSWDPLGPSQSLRLTAQGLFRLEISEPLGQRACIRYGMQVRRKAGGSAVSGQMGLHREIVLVLQRDLYLATSLITYLYGCHRPDELFRAQTTK